MVQQCLRGSKWDPSHPCKHSLDDPAVLQRFPESWALYNLSHTCCYIHIKSRRISRCNHTEFHLEKLKDSLGICHAVICFQSIQYCRYPWGPVETWDTLKSESLKAAKECIWKNPRSKCGFVSIGTLTVVEKRHTTQQHNTVLSVSVHGKSKNLEVACASFFTILLWYKNAK